MLLSHFYNAIFCLQIVVKIVWIVYIFRNKKFLMLFNNESINQVLNCHITVISMSSFKGLIKISDIQSWFMFIVLKHACMYIK